MTDISKLKSKIDDILRLNPYIKRYAYSAEKN